ncbi:UDP-N-acetylglucosamine 2-epimerase (non-hydrolyzing) [Cytobacillus solani]|uniref:non-hydrolyzing UDP-N-acetylglucosamine 2-epimerase n=1 Tax=Cytobacillus solani TaxID=1637975 RepID=UPI00207A03E7|nr:UDP-N-acetylglucosamine 2-epimerase (non-hydrolyzing) [Cytobacillus solani]USK54616.1 UDP-N-acetylglucosamine 2-epimerase (non-hydrolyzing) [Cytobacillus solani]
MDKRVKVMIIFGTRPEAIKMAPLIKELEKYPNLIDSKITVTAQHRQMLDQVLGIFKIKPHYDLNVMKDCQSLTEVTMSVLDGLNKVLNVEKPDLVLVHGDTTTAFVASLAAYYNQILVGHVEAGLRTWDRYSPFPEELNRQLTGIIANLHFSPTFWAKQNLIKENKNPNSIFVTGNTVIDALSMTVTKNFRHSVIEKIGHDKMILLTVHRRENLGNPMKKIFKAIKLLVNTHRDVQVVYPVHLNPSVREVAYEILGNESRVHLIEPLGVVDFHNFISRAHIILTDSGGIQEEAPSFGIPVLVLRNTTERPEGIEAGTLKLVGTNEEEIYKVTNELLINSFEYRKMANISNPYGDGQASYRIVQSILYYFGKTNQTPQEFI